MKSHRWLQYVGLCVVIALAGMLLWGCSSTSSSTLSPTENQTEVGTKPTTGTDTQTCPIMGDLTRTLGLTTEQVPRVQEIQMSAMEAMMPYHQTMIEKEQAINEALHATTSDPIQIKQLVDEQANAMASCQKVMVDAQLALKEVLTAEQYAKLPACTMMSSMMEGMMGPMDGQSDDHAEHHGG